MEELSGEISQFDSATYGVAIEKFDEPFILYPAVAGSVQAFHKRVRVVALLMGILFAEAVVGLGFELNWLVAYLFLLTIVYFGLRRKYLRAVSPVLELRTDGLQIHSLYCEVFIPWAEIKEVRTFHLVETHLGIEPYNLRRCLARSSNFTKVFGTINGVAVYLYNIFGISVCPLFVLETELPLEAEVVADYINIRRNHALKLDSMQEISGE